jgi:DNA-binding IclR family transcriptional regulator
MHVGFETRHDNPAAKHDEAVGMKPVRSVNRAVSLLFLVAESERPMGLTEISRRLALDKATALRLLSTLEESKLVQQDPVTKRYSGGPGLSRLSNAWRGDLRQVAAPYLRALSQVVNECITLMCPRDLERVCVEALPTRSQELTVMPVLGRTAPIYAGASGKIFLAHMTEKEFERIVERTELRPVTSADISDRRALLRRLKLVRERGYEHSTGTVTPGATALAAPIFGPDGQVVGTVAVRGPTIRMTKERVKLMAPKVIQTANEISEALGGAHVPAVVTA